MDSLVVKNTENLTQWYRVIEALAQRHFGGQSLITTMRAHLNCDMKMIEKEPGWVHILDPQFLRTTHQSLLVTPFVKDRVLTPSTHSPPETNSGDEVQRRFESRSKYHNKKWSLCTPSTCLECGWHQERNGKSSKAQVSERLVGRTLKAEAFSNYRSKDSSKSSQKSKTQRQLEQWVICQAWPWTISFSAQLRAHCLWSSSHETRHQMASKLQAQMVGEVVDSMDHYR